MTASFEEQDAALEDKDPWSADEEDQTEAEESAAESEAIESSASAAEMVPGFWVRWQGQEVRLTFERAADPLYGVVITGQDSRAEVPLSEICLLRQM